MGLGGRTWASSKPPIFAILIFPPVDVNASLQWWDAVEETNRPHGFAFSKITDGLITDMKVWKVSSDNRELTVLRSMFVLNTILIVSPLVGILPQVAHRTW